MKETRGGKKGKGEKKKKRIGNVGGGGKAIVKDSDHDEGDHEGDDEEGGKSEADKTELAEEEEEDTDEDSRPLGGGEEAPPQAQGETSP